MTEQGRLGTLGYGWGIGNSVLSPADKFRGVVFRPFRPLRQRRSGPDAGNRRQPCPPEGIRDWRPRATPHRFSDRKRRGLSLTLVLYAREPCSSPQPAWETWPRSQ